ncbi:E3 ubiquitin-protein ligase TRIM39 isoform X1 [Megalops cyprinoides]|uniref:E3 ubiquitin-protein ligase TRIM39 isoform X1 n=1 Tax=Megalops cyprinoides TaxID=118141 RepID=UPI0018654C04|nr:E3 ubiquitin-protein ligase TRIM39 isoform X1 [Megalops cyprinoides]
MALSRSFLSEEQFQCSICLDIFTNPVSTPCGHSFCMACIGHYWSGSAACQCPLCKESFRRRPELHINRTLREITEQFKRMSGRSVSDQPPARPAELSCTLLDEMKRKFQKVPATRSPHLPASVSAASGPVPGTSLRRYTLSGAANSLHTPLCPKHQRPLKFFCRTDRDYICGECVETGHQVHDTVSIEKEWLVNKSQLGTSEAEVQQMIECRIRKVEEIRTSLVDLKALSERETQGSVRMFAALVSSVERSQAELLEVIQMNRVAVEQHAEGLIRELEEEIEELRSRSDVLEQISRSNDYALFLKNFDAICIPPQTKDWSGVSVNSDLCVGAIYRTVSELVERFQEELQRLPGMSIRVPVDPSPTKLQPKVKTIQEYAADVTLDSSTAHPRLILSEDRKQVRCGDRYQHVPDNSERFDRVVCVLGREGFTGGRHYWEVEVGGKTDWDLGVASHSVSRKGKITINPSHGFWFLSFRDSNSYAFQTEPSTSLKPQKIGVFLDYEKGQVSFYNVNTKLHIYTFMDTFCETIYPFFSPCTNKSGRNEAPLVISPVMLPD